MDEENNSEQQQSGGNAIKDTIKEEGKEQAKKAIKEGAKTASKVAGKSSLMAALAPILLWVLAAIVFIVIIVGIIVFIVSMPGLVMGRLQEIMDEIKDGWNSFWGADSTKFVDDEQIYGVLDHLESLGYDLLSYGFLTGIANISTEEGKTYDNGVQRNNEGNITQAFSNYVKIYLVSDNYAYTMKNTNATDDFWFGALVKNVSKLFGNNDAGWGRRIIYFCVRKRF